MFDKEFLLEIFNTIKKNKLRTFLTGFSVAWGIFMLIILLGSGKGLENGIKENFKGEAKNTIRVYGGLTSIAYEGQPNDRHIEFNNYDKKIITENIPNIDLLSARYDIELDIPVHYKSEYATLAVSGIDPSTKEIEKIKLINGRYINEWDNQHSQKVAVIGKDAKKMLFKEKSPIGEVVYVNKVPLKVVGVFSDDYAPENKKIYMPLATAQKIFLGGNKISSFAMTLENITPDESKTIENNIKAKLAKRHKFSEKDERAVLIINSIEEFAKAQKLFRAINIFLWLIAIGTIIAGVVGISNIMLIVVKERTKEIGVRKAIGATPASIVKLILLEAVIITIIAGLIGLLAGSTVLEISNSFLEAANTTQAAASEFDENITIFKNPSVDMTIALNALIVLILSGLLAGFIPAKRAAQIRPIAALREE